MIHLEYMELAGKCNHPACPHDKRDGEEVACINKTPQSTHPAEWLCKLCNYWEATPENQVMITISRGKQ